jgi:hypothetical protein
MTYPQATFYVLLATVAVQVAALIFMSVALYKMKARRKP